MKTIQPIFKVRVTLADLLPTGEELQIAAYESMAGDEATSPEGRHGGSDPGRPDMNGLSKRLVYRRALENDLGWFDAVAAAVRADPYAWAPSLRTWKSKGKGKGSRPIDDPPEIKRLVALVVRAKLGKKFISRFTGGQLGSRPGTFCTRKGATAQDQVAVAIWQAIKQGCPWCVLIDLADAFGRVPELLALREFGRMGLDAEAAKFLWHLVRIYAVTNRDLSTLETRDKMGIEQGNPLSAFIMDLVLAPVMGRIEARHDVRAYSYLDDLHLMTRSEPDAKAAYESFRAIAEGLGFDNVRDLWVPGGREPKGKNSLIVNSDESPIRVLKTYDIDLLGISAAPEKEVDYRLKLKKDGKTFVRLNLNQARKALNCQALTFKATTARNHLLFRHPPPGGCHQSPSVPGRPSSPSRSTTRKTMTLGVHAHKEKVTDDVQSPFRGIAPENPVEEPISFGRGATFNGVFPQSKHVEDDQEGGHRIDLPEDDDNLTLPLGGQDQEVGALCPCADESEVTLPEGQGSQGDDPVPDVLLPPLGVGDGHHGLGLPHPHGDTGLRLRSSQRNQAGSVHLHQEGDSTTAEGPHKPCGPSRADDGDRPAARFLSLGEPAVHGALAAGHGFKLGTMHKGAVLDLTGLEDLGLDDKKLPEVVNGLIKAVRAQRKATVIIDPVEPWTVGPAILGKTGDKTYERLAARNLPDGRTMLTLRHRVRKPKPTKGKPAPPPSGVDAVLAVRRKNRAAGTYELRVVEGGQRCIHEVVVGVPSTAAGTVAAVAAWVVSRPGRTVAVLAEGHLAAVVTMLKNKQCLSPNIDYGDAVRALLAARVWTSAGDWACGRCSGRT